MAVVVGPGRKVGVGENDTTGPAFICHPTDQTAATILISLGALGIGANLALMAVILLRRPLRRSVEEQQEIISWLYFRSPQSCSVLYSPVQSCSDPVQW